MPVGKTKYVVIKTQTRKYHILCWKIGGAEPFFAEKGYWAFDCVVGVVLGTNAGLLMERVGGNARYSMEKAGFYADDLEAGWGYVLIHYDRIPEGLDRPCVIVVTLNKRKKWEVKVEEEVIA